MRLTIRPTASGPFSRFDPANTTDQVISDNGMPVVAYTQQEYEEAATFGLAAWIVGLVFLLFAFVFCLFDWKEIGL